MKKIFIEYCSLALRVIHKAGWIHRDLSVANLYLYIDPDTGEKRGIIGDFEYSKRAGSGAKGDFKAVNSILSPLLLLGQINSWFLIGNGGFHGH